MLKVAFAVSHLRLRLDIRDLISWLHERTELTVYLKKSEIPYLPDGITFVRIEDRTEHPLGAIAGKLYTLLGKLPRHDFYYKSYLKRRNESRGITKLSLKDRIIQRAPKLLSFDRYLGIIGRKDSDLAQFDVFLGITDTVNNQLYADARASLGRVNIYLSSWDHPQKFPGFMKEGARYLVWNQSHAEDLRFFHAIEPQDVTVVGGGQFSYLHAYLEGISSVPAAGRNEESPYIYAIGTFGYPALARQEVSLLLTLSGLLAEVHPGWKIKFRVYPFLADEAIYAPLKQLENLVFDDYSVEPGKLLFDREDIRRKFSEIENARGLFHLGTTMGLEAAYFDVPVCSVKGTNFDDETVDFHSRLSQIQAQYHIKKYFLLGDYPNLAENDEELRDFLAALDRPQDLLRYNRDLRTFMELVSFEAFARNVLQALEKQGGD